MLPTLGRFLCFVLGIVVGGILILSAAELPLPYRGALTREAWREVAAGAYPELTCARAEDTTAALVARTVASLPFTGAHYCLDANADSTETVELWLDDGAVTRVRHSWIAPPARASAIADSLEAAWRARAGAPAPCGDATPPGRRLAFGQARLTLEAWQAMPVTGGSADWLVELTRDAGGSVGCGGRGRPLGG